MNETVINAGIIVAYILLGMAALVAIVGPMIQLVVNFKNAKTTLLGVAVLVAILLIGYSLATNEVYDGDGFSVGPMASQWIGGGIIATMILIGLAILSAIFTEIAKFFK
jgi:predicted ABC-type exoprotein transport system permease subunit